MPAEGEEIEMSKSTGILASLDSLGYRAENEQAGTIFTIRDAVAEYIAANDEYDAARADYDNTAPSHRGKKWGTLCSATSRRALAHARMKGEAK